MVELHHLSRRRCLLIGREAFRENHVLDTVLHLKEQRHCHHLLYEFHDAELPFGSRLRASLPDMRCGSCGLS